MYIYLRGGGNACGTHRNGHRHPFITHGGKRYGSGGKVPHAANYAVMRSGYIYTCPNGSTAAGLRALRRACVLAFICSFCTNIPHEHNTIFVHCYILQT